MKPRKSKKLRDLELERKLREERQHEVLKLSKELSNLKYVADKKGRKIDLIEAHRLNERIKELKKLGAR